MKTDANCTLCKVRLSLSNNGYINVATNNLASITAKSSLNCLTETFFGGMSISQNYLDGQLMHMLTQDKQSTSCKLPDNKLVMLVINWATLCGIWNFV